MATSSTGAEATIKTEDLRTLGLEEDLSLLEIALAGNSSPEEPNIAVISEPLAGREQVLEYAIEQSPTIADRVTLSDTRIDSKVFDDRAADIQVIDNCHYLYTRQIGGFDVLDAVLDTIAISDTVIISSWNRYAWEYLVAVRSIDRVFPVQITLPALDPEQIGEVITRTYDTDELHFVDDREIEHDSLVETTAHELAIGSTRSITLPRPRLNFDVLRSWRAADADIDIRELVFARLTDLANGNPGIAKAIWEQSVSDGTISLNGLQEPPRGIELTDSEAYALQIILTKERLRTDVLASIVNESDIDRLLQSLVQQRLVERDGNQVAVRPIALPTIIGELERRRLLW